MRLPRLRFSVRQLMVVVAVVALELVQAQFATFALMVIGAAVAIGSLLARRRNERPRSWAIPYLVTLTCLYLPFAWVLWDVPWDAYRWEWIKLGPVLPGLIAGMAVHPDDAAMIRISGLVTILLVALFTRLGQCGRVVLVVANALALVGSALESWLAYQLFLW